MFNNLYFKVFVIFLCLTCSQVWGQQNIETSYIKAQKGILDLSKVDPETLLKNYPLDGEWKFYPNQRLEALDPKKIDKVGPFAYVTVPDLWKDFPEHTKELREFKKGLPGGIGTYELTLLLPAGHEPFFIESKIIDYSFELWVNGILQRRSGEVDKDNFYIHQNLAARGNNIAYIIKAINIEKKDINALKYKIHIIVSNKENLAEVYSWPGIKKLKQSDLPKFISNLNMRNNCFKILFAIGKTKISNAIKFNPIKFKIGLSLEILLLNFNLRIIYPIEIIEIISICK